MAYVKTTWVNDETIVNAQRMNHIEDGIKNLESVSLLAVSDTAPSECVEGDLYYNTTTKKIYQAIDTDVWDSEGTDPLDKILYIVFSTKTTYSLDDNGDLISVGGGGAEISVSTTEPEEQEVLWINPEDAPSGSLNPITNQYSVATDKGYSCNYINNSLEPCKTIVFDNQWLFAFYPRGMGLNIIVPMYNPEQKNVTVNLSNKELFTGSQWTSLGDYQVNAIFPTFMILGFGTTGLGLGEGETWLIRIKGTISVND